MSKTRIATSRVIVRCLATAAFFSPLVTFAVMDYCNEKGGLCEMAYQESLFSGAEKVKNAQATPCPYELGFCGRMKKYADEFGLPSLLALSVAKPEEAFATCKAKFQLAEKCPALADLIQEDLKNVHKKYVEATTPKQPLPVDPKPQILLSGHWLDVPLVLHFRNYTDCVERVDHIKQVMGEMRPPATSAELADDAESVCRELYPNAGTYCIKKGESSDGKPLMMCKSELYTHGTKLGDANHPARLPIRMRVLVAGFEDCLMKAKIARAWASGGDGDQVQLQEIEAQSFHNESKWKDAEAGVAHEQKQVMLGHGLILPPEHHYCRALFPDVKPIHPNPHWGKDGKCCEGAFCPVQPAHCYSGYPHYSSDHWVPPQYNEHHGSSCSCPVGVDGHRDMTLPLCKSCPAVR